MCRLPYQLRKIVDKIEERSKNAEMELSVSPGYLDRIYQISEMYYHSYNKEITMSHSFSSIIDYMGIDKNSKEYDLSMAWYWLNKFIEKESE